MKTKLLFITALVAFSLNAQTTHNLDWAAGSGTMNDLTIVSGDTVIWTWTSPNHSVQNTPGSSVETFNSGDIVPIGSTYEYTFNVVGDNHYFCGVHGAANMSGTITVNEDLSVPEEELNTFSIFPNPATSFITLKLPTNSNTSQIILFNILGEKVISLSIDLSGDTQIDLSALNSGLYIIKVNNGEQSQTKRIVKL